MPWRPLKGWYKAYGMYCTLSVQYIHYTVMKMQFFLSLFTLSSIHSTVHSRHLRHSAAQCSFKTFKTQCCTFKTFKTQCCTFKTFKTQYCSFKIFNKQYCSFKTFTVRHTNVRSRQLRRCTLLFDD